LLKKAEKGLAFNFFENHLREMQIIMLFRKPKAKLFKRWITHEILPSIRKDRGYIHAAPGDTDADIMAKAPKRKSAAVNRRLENQNPR
jgi:prophage antirepressor-like protein